MKISAKFPYYIDETQANLFKPSYAGLDYIPSFVDKIEAVVTNEEGVVLRKCSGLCEEGDSSINNEFDLGDVPYGVYNLELKAYAYNSRNSAGSRWIETHRGAINGWVVGVSLGSKKLEVGLDIAGDRGSGIMLDENPINMSERVHVDSPTIYPSSYYCTAVNDAGEFYIAWVEEVEDIYFLKLLSRDSRGDEIIPQTVIAGPSNFRFAVPRECFFIGDSLYIAYAKENEDSTFDILGLKYRFGENASVVTVEEGIYLDTPLDAGFAFHAARDYVAFVYRKAYQTGNYNLVKIYDIDLNPLFGPCPFAGQHTGNPSVFISSGNEMFLLNAANVIFIQPYRIGDVLNLQLIGDLSRDQNALSYLRLFEINFPPSIHPPYQYSYVFYDSSKIFIAHDRSDVVSLAAQDVVLINYDLADPDSAFSVYMFADDEGDDFIARLQPAIAKYRGSNLAIAWSGQNEYAQYEIGYSLPSSVRQLGGTDKNLAYSFDFSELAQYFRPDIAVNDDGLAFITALRTHPTEPPRLVTKRYLF